MCLIVLDQGNGLIGTSWIVTMKRRMDSMIRSIAVRRSRVPSRSCRPAANDGVAVRLNVRTKAMVMDLIEKLRMVIPPHLLAWGYFEQATDRPLLKCAVARHLR